MPANRLRGEVTLELCGKEYTLRPTFEALCLLEDNTDKSVIQILASMEGGKVRLHHLASLIWAGMYGFNPDTAPSVKEVGDMVLKTGLLGLLEQTDKDGKNPISEFLINGVMGGEETVNQTTTGDPKTQVEGENLTEEPTTST